VTLLLCLAFSDWMLHRTSPVWGANRSLIGQSNSEAHSMLRHVSSP
jgi:hypothetical protein